MSDRPWWRNDNDPWWMDADDTTYLDSVAEMQRRLPCALLEAFPRWSDSGKAFWDDLADRKRKAEL